MISADLARTVQAQCLGELTICSKARYRQDGVFLESKYFKVEACPTPHVSRTDGGHLIIKPKNAVENRWELPQAAARELTVLTEVMGRALKKALIEIGIPVARVNFQDNGNWALDTERGPSFHLHLYGRASNSANQKHGEALYFPDKATEFWRGLEMLTIDDVVAITKHAELIVREERYAAEHWDTQQA
jgi:diadenosine tetraphosphate (Ap4A) HIT family hydrolase